MKLVLLIAVAGCLAACAGSGEGGAWTPQDTVATTNAINGVYSAGARAYYDYNHGYNNYGPQPTVIVP